MAWISVHEQVIGGKLRKLAKKIGCSSNEALGILVRLWLWAINNAEKDGCISWADKKDIAEIIHIGIDRRYNPDDVVDALVDTNWIDMENGLYIHDWEEWQEQWYKAVEVRERDAKRKRKERERKRIAIQTAEERRVIPEELSTTEKENSDLPTPQLIVPAEDQKPKMSEYTKDFEEFWEVYPRKVGKGEAYKKYKARLNDGWKESELLEAAKNYADRVSAERTEQKYIKHGKTFLSENTPFADFLPSGICSGRQDTGNDDDPYAEWRS